MLGYNPAATTGYYAGFHDFFGLPIDPRGNIIGVLIAAWACARIEGMVRRFMPDDLDMLLTSLITLLITATLAYLIIMPLGGWLFEGMSWLFMHLNSNPLGCAVLAGLFLIAVVFGVHQGFIPVYLALMDSQGFNSLFPILSMAGAGSGRGAGTLLAGATARCATQSGTRAIIPGLLGVGEPLIYGVTLPRMKPFITACLGGAAGGLFIGLIARWGLADGLKQCLWAVWSGGAAADDFRTRHPSRQWRFMLAGFWWHGFAGLFSPRSLAAVTSIWTDTMKRTMLYLSLLAVSCSVSAAKYPVLTESSPEKAEFNVERLNQMDRWISQQWTPVILA